MNSRVEKIAKSNQQIKELTETSTSGIGAFVITSSFGNKDLLGKIVQIKERKCKGAIVYDLHVQPCKRVTIKNEWLSPITVKETNRIVPNLDKSVCVIKNITDFDVQEEISTRTWSHD